MQTGSESAAGESAWRHSQYFVHVLRQGMPRTSAKLDNASRDDLDLLANVSQLLPLILRNLPPIARALVFPARNALEYTDIEAKVEEDFDGVGAARKRRCGGDGELVSVERVGESRNREGEEGLSGDW